MKKPVVFKPQDEPMRLILKRRKHLLELVTSGIKADDVKEVWFSEKISPEEFCEAVGFLGERYGIEI